MLRANKGKKDPAGFIKMNNRQPSDVNMDMFTYIFGQEKAHLSRRLRGFEVRPQQVQMVRAVDEALKKKRHLIVEAGTGVGKSVAYLLPLIKWAKEHNKKVVISTYTKTLQEQLVKKDLPRLQRILGLDFKFALCMGSQNYLCLRRYNKEGGLLLFDNDQERRTMAEVKQWLPKIKTGLRTEFPFPFSEEAWAKVGRDSDQCMGKESPYHKECFYFKARREIREADILVTNHHLFFSHIASNGKVLPSFDAVVFDEAHTLEDVATSYLGMELSNTQIKHYLDSLFNPKTKKGLLCRIKGISSHDTKLAIQNVEEVRKAAEIFFTSIILKYGLESQTIRIRQKQIVENTLGTALEIGVSHLKKMVQCVQNKEDEVELVSFITRGENFCDVLKTVLNMSLDNHVYWIEITKKLRMARYTLRAAPINIADEFRKKIFDRIKPVILTSATVSVDSHFEFIKKRFGMKGEVDELLLDSPFDYKKNVTLYMPSGMPNPVGQTQLYQQKVIEGIKEILLLMQGRTFILFTSFKMMNDVEMELGKSFPHLQILKQGNDSRYRLLEMFKGNPNAVLLGTNTFWQGIDMPGKALECVIITKLPFAVPDEPVVEAKMEFLKSQGKNPFEHYQLPRAIIMLKQGFGRLIRTHQDSGIVAILDPRIKTKQYGQKFLDALPCCRKVHRLCQVKEIVGGEQ